MNLSAGVKGSPQGLPARDFLMLCLQGQSAQCVAISHVFPFAVLYGVVIPAECQSPSLNTARGHGRCRVNTTPRP